MRGHRGIVRAAMVTVCFAAAATAGPERAPNMAPPVDDGTQGERGGGGRPGPDDKTVSQTGASEGINPSKKPNPECKSYSAN